MFVCRSEPVFQLTHIQNSTPTSIYWSHLQSYTNSPGIKHRYHRSLSAFSRSFEAFKYLQSLNFKKESFFFFRSYGGIKKSWQSTVCGSRPRVELRLSGKHRVAVATDVSTNPRGERGCAFLAGERLCGNVSKARKNAVTQIHSAKFYIFFTRSYYLLVWTLKKNNKNKRAIFASSTSTTRRYLGTIVYDYLLWSLGSKAVKKDHFRVTTGRDWWLHESV